eukprot:403371495
MNCQCTVCSNCYQNLTKNRLKKEITCPQCSTASIKSVKPSVNEIILRKIEAQNSLIITCDNHQTEMVSHYCIECETPVCTYCQLDDTHNSHQIVKISRSQFANYTTNVLRIFDEYQIENIKAELGQQRDNEISMNSMQLLQAISKVTRMLGPHIDEEETMKIDFKNYMLDPSSQQNNVWKQNSKVTKEDFNEFKHLVQDQINQQLEEFQTIMRQELKQTLNAFEINQNDINNQVQNQADIKIKETKDNQQKVLDEFKRESQSLLKEEIKSEFDKRLNDYETRVQTINKNNEELNQKLINSFIQQAQEGKCNCQNEIQLLNYKFAEYNDKIEQLKLLTQNEINDQANKLLEFQKSVKSIATKADIDQINQKMNSQEKQRQQFESEYQILKKSVQTIQESQDKQTKEYKQTQQQQQQVKDASTEKLHAISIKHEQELQDSKIVQTAFDQRLTSLEQELKSAQSALKDKQNQLESAFEEQSKQFNEEMKNLPKDQESLKIQQETFTNDQLQNTNQLENECDYSIIIGNNSQIEEEVKSSDIRQDNMLDNISQTLATIDNQEPQQEEQKFQAINGNNISLVQVPSVEELNMDKYLVDTHLFLTHYIVMIDFLLTPLHLCLV